MLKSAKEMNKIAGDVRNARIEKARAEAEVYVNDVAAKAIEKKANDGCYSVTICISKADVGAGYVTDLLREAGYEVKRGTEVLTVGW